uniref:phage recombination protein Bet n=1 Tax=Marinobacterium profundum TaxID=1714300 RepID=UPI00082AE492|nr:phage recombination protein Bet [Marinobacterium profundum]
MDKPTLTARFAERFSVDPAKLFETLKATAFRQRDGSVPNNEQMMALLVVADQYGLNPFTKEIYAFPDKHAGIIPVVGVDGWSRIINQHDQFDGMEFRSADTRVTPEGAKECPEWMECIIYRRDRSHPVKITEYLDEVYRPPFEGMGNNGPFRSNGPWQTHTKRMLRHKAMIQCSRIAFGFVGIFDQDEAERILEAQATVVVEPQLADPAQVPARTQGLVSKLIERAEAAGAWNSALEYAQEHFQGTDLAFAQQQIHIARQQVPAPLEARQAS